jgi:hypothetical protein
MLNQPKKRFNTIEDLKWDSRAFPIILNFNRIGHEDEKRRSLCVPF